MRILAALIAFVSLLTTPIQLAQVAGDIGPDKNGGAPTVRLAGDIGPDKNG